MCISIPDAYYYLTNSYRPYQQRNNKLAATYDGAHGQAAQVQMGMAALQNGTASSPTALADAGNKSEQAQGTVLDVGGVQIIGVIAQAVKEGVAPLMNTIAETQTKHSEHFSNHVLHLDEDGATAEHSSHATRNPRLLGETHGCLRIHC